MSCKDCPYGEEDFIKLKDFNTESPDKELKGYIWCDKVGGKVSWYGKCNEDEFAIQNYKNHFNKKRRNKRERYLKHQKHLKHLAEDTSGYPTPAYYVDEIRVRKYGYIANPRPYYKRLYRGQRSKYIKKLSNRKIRRYKGELSKGYMCHKLYDFWNEMY